MMATKNNILGILNDDKNNDDFMNDTEYNGNIPNNMKDINISTVVPESEYRAALAGMENKLHALSVTTTTTTTNNHHHQHHHHQHHDDDKENTIIASTTNMTTTTEKTGTELATAKLVSAAAKSLPSHLERVVTVVSDEDYYSNYYHYPGSMNNDDNDDDDDDDDSQSEGENNECIQDNENDDDSNIVIDADEEDEDDEESLLDVQALQRVTELRQQVLASSLALKQLAQRVSHKAWTLANEEWTMMRPQNDGDINDNADDTETDDTTSATPTLDAMMKLFQREGSDEDEQHASSSLRALHVLQSVLEENHPKVESAQSMLEETIDTVEQGMDQELSQPERTIKQRSEGTWGYHHHASSSSSSTNDHAEEQLVRFLEQN